MKIEKTPIEGVMICSPDIHKDNRGEFQELYKASEISWIAYLPIVKQISRSVSSRHVFRGIHLQSDMRKVMRVTRGAAFIYNIDLDPGSPTFCKTVRIWSEAGDNQLIFGEWWIGRAFCAVEDGTEIEYFHSSTFDPSKSYTIQWNDPRFNLTLPTYNPIMSEKDKHGLSVDEWISLWSDC
jgi:dTDP-4-dehydrorhamnose 3,5-epimerase